MPIYEYQADDGTVLELRRTMGQADDPVPDPDGKGRVFRRRLSAVRTGGSAGASAGTSLPLSGGGGCCPCGKNAGACGTRN